MKKRSRNKRKNIITLASILLILTGLITFIICLLLTPKIELIEPELFLPVGSPYKDPGYQAYSNNHDVTNQVKITGQVNSQKLGTYMITYEATYLLFHTKKIRIVEVIDKEPPILELMGKEEVFVCPNKTYQEEGYQAIDNHDKDLTKKVKIKDQKDERIYEVKDTSGNKTIKKRIIHYEDKEKPEIKIKGQSTLTIYVNNNYQEPGYQAFDNCDGDITSKVTIHNNINEEKEGNYTITYQVTDTAGNQTTVIRTIIVTKRPTNQNGVIYLTFDDGPSSTITGPILDILKEEGVLATFFVINHSEDLNPLIKREFDEGHTVALHSFTHDYKTVYFSETNYFQDLEKIQAKVKRITGQTSMIIRFPGGSSNTISKRYQPGIMTNLTKEVVKRGYHYFDWNVGSGDAGDVHSSEEVYQNVISSLSHQKANVILMHDFEKNYYTLNTLRAIIKYGKENGYTFQKITMDTPMVTHKVAN